MRALERRNKRKEALKGPLHVIALEPYFFLARFAVLRLAALRFAGFFAAVVFFFAALRRAGFLFAAFFLAATRLHLPRQTSLHFCEAPHTMCESRTVSSRVQGFWEKIPDAGSGRIVARIASGSVLRRRARDE